MEEGGGHRKKNNLHGPDNPRRRGDEDRAMERRWKKQTLEAVSSLSPKLVLGWPGPKTIDKEREREDTIDLIDHHL